MVSNIREEAERIANGDGVIDYGDAQKQAERVLMLLDMCEKMANNLEVAILFLEPAYDVSNYKETLSEWEKIG